MSIGIISAQDFAQLLNDTGDLSILDIRSEFEFQNIKLDYPVIHIPMHDITAEKIKEVRTGSEPLYILCKMGPRAQTIAQFLNVHGQENLIIIDGGITGCKAENVQIHQKDQLASPHDIAEAVQDSVQKFMIRQGQSL